MYSRHEITRMSDTTLDIAFDGTRRRISLAWESGRGGNLSDMALLTLMACEMVIRGRGIPGPPLVDPDQLTLFDVDRHGQIIGG